MTYLFIAWATPISITTIVHNELDDRSSLLAEELSQTPLQGSGPAIDRFIRQTGASILVYDDKGDLIDVNASGMDSLADADNPVSSTVINDVSIDVMVAGESAISTTTSLDFAGEQLAEDQDYSSYPLTFANSTDTYTLAVMSNTAAEHHAKQALLRVLPYMILFVLAISTLGAILYSRHITKPIVRLSGISLKMAQLDFTYKCQEGRSDEIGVLGQSLDALSDRLSTALKEVHAANAVLQQDIDRERGLEQQRSAFFSAASHELKTPITILKGQLSGMLAGVDIYRDRDKYLLRSLAVANRMEETVRGILEIARMENTDFALKKERIDLTALVKVQYEQLAELAEQKKQSFDNQAETGLTSTGDADLLARAVANLFSNASLYSPEGSAISVSLTKRGGCPVLLVHNGNASIPDEDLKLILKPFHRVDSSRNRSSGGSGLGLYLANLIFSHHGATLLIENRNGGVTATVVFANSDLHPSST